MDLAVFLYLCISSFTSTFVEEGNLFPICHKLGGWARERAHPRDCFFIMILLLRQGLTGSHYVAQLASNSPSSCLNPLSLLSSGIIGMYCIMVGNGCGLIYHLGTLDYKLWLYLVLYQQTGHSTINVTSLTEQFGDSSHTVSSNEEHFFFCK